MRFWKIEELKTDLQPGNLDQKEALAYLLATGVVTIAMDFIPLGPFSLWDHVYTTAGLIIFFLGAIYAFQANGGRQGRDFLGRYISISWVLGIRLLVLLLVPLLVVVFSFEEVVMGGIPDEMSAPESAVLSVWLIVFYWRLALHMRALSSSAAV